MVDHRRLATSTKAIQATAGATISVGESRGSVRHDRPSPLLPHQAESEALKLKWVMLPEGLWVAKPYRLIRSPDGKLSDQPVNNGDEECAVAP